MSVTQKHGEAGVVAFHRIYAIICGNPIDGLFLSQAAFLAGLPESKKRGGSFYRTKEEWDADICVTRKQVDRIVENLTELGFIKTWYERLSHRMWFKVNFDAIEKAIELSPKPKVDFPECTKGTLGNVQKGHSKTETTAENTYRELREGVQGSASTDGEATPFTLSADPGLPVSSPNRCDSTGVPNALAPSLASRIDSMTSPTQPPTLPKKVSRKAKQPKPSRPDYTAEFYVRIAGAWKDKAGAWPQMGRMRVEFRRLYDCGWTEAEVEAGWARYLAETELSFLSTGAFASRPAKWCRKAGTEEASGPPRGYSQEEFDRITGRGKYANMGGQQ